MASGRWRIGSKSFGTRSASVDRDLTLARNLPVHGRSLTLDPVLYSHHRDSASGVQCDRPAGADVVGHGHLTWGCPAARALWHPLSIVVAVLAIGAGVSLAGEVLFRGGAAAVPAMLRRSAIGSLGWGVVIAAVDWVGRRLLVAPSDRT